MEPIISPWLIYLLSFIDAIKTFMVVSTVLVGIALGGYLIVFAMSRDRVLFEDDTREVVDSLGKRYFLKAIATFLLMFFLAITIPNRNTVIAMLVAQNITPNNINKVVKKGEALKDSIKKDVLDILTAIQRGRDNDRSHPSKQP